MSEEFTEIEFGSDLQTKKWRREMTIAELQDIEDKTILDELYLAFFERLAVVGCADPYYWAFMEIDCSDTVSIIRIMQTFLDGGIGNGTWGPISFVDHAQTSGSNIVYYTIDSFRTAAGLVDDDDDPVGFRRTNDWDGHSEPEFEYGPIQRGDVIGYWIYEDLQKAFSVLRWTSGGGGYSVVEGRSGSGVKQNIPDALAEAAYAYSQGDWGWHQFGTVLAQTLNVLDYTGNFYAWLCRRKSRITGGGSTVRPYTWDLYVTTDEPTAYMGDPGESLYECTDLGIPVNTPTLVASGNDSSVVFDFGSLEQPPWPDPIPDYLWGIGTRGYNYKSATFLYKYDFTNQNADE